jgi:hypothetical protein
MAVRAPRTRFAASVVAIVAGCGAKPPAAEWAVTAHDGRCFASPVVCSHCNPPAPTPIPCPAGVATDGSARIATYDSATCVLEGTSTGISCPGDDSLRIGDDRLPPDAGPPDAPPPPFVARRWSIDGACRAERVVGACPPKTFCNPPPPEQMTCPPFHVRSRVDEVAPGRCVEPGGADVPCPGE